MRIETSIAKPVLQTRGLERHLGSGADRIHVLRGIDFSLQPGKVVAIVGPSGCGKSTLLYLLGLLDRPDAVEIYLGGDRVDNADEQQRTLIRGRQIGFVFQFHFLLAEFSAAENLMLPMIKHRTHSREAARERAEELLNLVGLAEKANRKGNQLSGGERQRVAVARAMANDPALILADEPTGNLDFKNSEKLFEHMRHLARSFQRGILIVTHNQDLAELCDECLEMKDGLFV